MLTAQESFVCVMTPEEWETGKEKLSMGIDMEVGCDVGMTKAEVNTDSLTGSFSIPSRQALTDDPKTFAFVLDERGIVFIDAGDSAMQIVTTIAQAKRWKSPSMERFLYDFLESIIVSDLSLLEEREEQLSDMEDAILDGNLDGQMERIIDMRNDLLKLRLHYEQLMDFGQELEENENGFFKKGRLRYFELFTKRVMRLQDVASGVRDHTVQVRELYQSQQQEKQNHLMGVLTAVSTIFLPLTLIAGWYGMNFTNMPLIQVPWGYPLIIVVSVVVAVLSVWYFKKHDWF
ncbi:MAG: magnesium transporter CorA [Clostridia bacterium]|nr:magnesium transporter CorA [Clostridia bacterium]